MDEANDCLYDLNEHDDILNYSRQTGTPALSTDEQNSEDEFLEALGDVSNDNQKYLDLMRNTDIRTILSGDDDRSVDPVLQVFNFEILSKGGCYRACAHDGKITTTKFAFTAEMNDRVKELIGSLPILRISNFKLYNGSFIVVMEFEIIEKLKHSIAAPKFFSEADYVDYKEASKVARKTLPRSDPSYGLEKTY